MKTMIHSKKGGFTLIELLVVIAIIGLLSSIVFASLTTARARGRDARRVSDLTEMAKAIGIIDTDPGPAIAGCVGANAKASTCSGPAPLTFANYADPSAPAAACTSASAAKCEYSVATAAGAAAATTQNYEICAYLEQGIGTLAAGLVRVASDTGGGVVATCK